MRIGICDDVDEDRNKIYNWIKANYAFISDSCIFQFSCGEAVIDFMNNSHLDVLFLDCRMDGLSGIETAERIRKKDKKIKIIVTTSFAEYAVFGYDAEIYRYILKSDFEKKTPEIFDKLISEYKLFDEKTHCIKTDAGIVNLLISDIVYIESELRKKKFIMTDQTIYKTYARMDELEESLEPFGFVRPHKSYLINSAYVHQFTNDKIFLTTNYTVTITRNYYEMAYNRLIDLLA